MATRTARPVDLALALLVVLATGLAGLGACSDDGGAAPQGPSATTGKLEPGESCSVDEECREGLVCHGTRRVCICTSDDSCPDELKCQPITGLCVSDVPGCKTDADCGDGAWCDEASRVCKALRAFCEPCRVDDECGAGNLCVGLATGSPQGFCGQACASTSDCATQRTHCQDGQCVPDTTCEDTIPCTPDTLQTCNADGECTEGREQLCDISIGQCVARLSGCGFGQQCNPVTLDCQPVCTGDADCQVGERCINSSCQAIAFCTGDADCAQSRICRIEPGSTEGECVPTCARSQDCPLGQICARDEQGRLGCRSGCATHADCAPNELCDGNARTCAGGAGVCQINDVCGSCQICSNNSCVPAGTPYCSGCTGSGLDASCGVGGACINGACAPPCPETGCPRGFQCSRVLDQNGNELTRACYPADGACDTECR